MTDFATQKQARIELATRQQRLASDPRRSVWVEASAGTGKTKVLSDRVLRLLLNGTPPGRILCLTYTKAAAVEMNTRIAGRLSRWAVISDEQLESELSKLLGSDIGDSRRLSDLCAQARKLFAVLLDTPGGMKIQTIHSFCQEILKRFPIEAKISPYFEVMDDRAAKEAIEEVKSRLLLKIEDEPDSPAGKALAYITKNVSEFMFPKLMETITANRNKIARLLANYDNLDGLIRTTADKLGIAPGTTREQVAAAFWNAADKTAVRSLAAAMSCGSDTDHRKGVVLEAALNGSNFANIFADYSSIFLTKDGEPRKSVATKAVFKIFPGGEEWAAREAERLQTCNSYMAAAALLASTTAVLYLADELIRGYTHYKNLHSKMDYEDLIVLTRRLLENPGAAEWVLYKLDGGIDNVLIDEAQDTSPDQWAIIRAVTDEFFNGKGAKDAPCTVFAVGDRKQSIYSFQGADPAEFDRMRRRFADKLSASGNFGEVNLEVSFRSTAAILDTVNCVFADEKAKSGVAPAGQTVVHTPSRIGEGGKVELWPLIEAEEGENPDVWLPPVERVAAESTSSRLARQIAERIRQMVGRGEKLVSQNRPLRYRDFMVLVQRRNSFVEELVRACKNAGVNVAGVDKIRLLEQIAVQDLLSVGKFMLLPSDDLTLAEILKSPLWGLTDNDLFNLAYNRGSQTLWQRLKAMPQYAETAAELQALLNVSDRIRPYELYAQILGKLGGRRKLVSRIGPEAEDGIDEFMNLCLKFEAEHIPSLQLFIDWAEKDEVEIKRELEQSEADTVRIMTVHGSKGLQAPVVILPDTVRVKSIRNEAGLLLDDVLYCPLKSDEYEDNCKAFKNREKELSLEEYRRLLYVALTRAEERLCICGYKMHNAPSEESWYELCKASLAKIATADDNGSLNYEVDQQLEVSPQPVAAAEPESCPDFSWLRTPAPQEGKLAKPLMPSKIDEAELETPAVSPITPGQTGIYRRGVIIHKLLQFLPDTETPDKTAVIREFLSRNAPEMDQRNCRQIETEVLRLLNDPQFAAVFAPGSKAEVPIMGHVDDRIISGKIDRLAVSPDRVLIVDFKTNRPAAATLAEVPAPYLKQMRAYRRLIEQIYPGRKVQTLILWTNTGRLMEII